MTALNSGAALAEDAAPDVATVAAEPAVATIVGPGEAGAGAARVAGVGQRQFVWWWTGGESRAGGRSGGPGQ